MRSLAVALRMIRITGQRLSMHGKKKYRCFFNIIQIKIKIKVMQIFIKRTSNTDRAQQQV
jgi:hypothetical protein